MLYEILYSELKRVFNVDFRHGGRFYDASHLELPREIRKNIVIDGEPTIEPDFSSMHPRMIYHLLGIDYRDDIYSLKCSKDMRNIMKAVCLRVINAKNAKSAYQSIKEFIDDKGYDVSHIKNPYKTLVEVFRTAHPNIAKYFYSNLGIELQHIDSAIMNNILRKCVDNDVPALPVHDSIRVPASKEDFIKGVMVEEYEKVMGFKPVIG